MFVESSLSGGSDTALCSEWGKQKCSRSSSTGSAAANGRALSSPLQHPDVVEELKVLCSTLITHEASALDLYCS